MGAHTINDLVDKRASMRLRMLELAGQFLRRCLRDVISSRDLLARLRCGDASVFEELERLAHRISGTGASFGFPTLSSGAGCIERLAQGQSGSATPDQVAIARLSECIIGLEREIHHLILAADADRPRDSR
ncbi:MAG: Hpt domain-containing protein [Pseudomonadota bacterium]|nr:Hpt domain-containing protein [Pseudomonadota bacterium]